MRFLAGKLQWVLPTLCGLVPVEGLRPTPDRTDLISHLLRELHHERGKRGQAKQHRREVQQQKATGVYDAEAARKREREGGAKRARTRSPPEWGLKMG